MRKHYSNSLERNRLETLLSDAGAEDQDKLRYGYKEENKKVEIFSEQSRRRWDVL